jgi:hypothetical protein
MTMYFARIAEVSMSDTNKNLVGHHFEEIWDQRTMAACDELMADFPSMGCAT